LFSESHTQNPAISIMGQTKQQAASANMKKPGFSLVGLVSSLILISRVITRRACVWGCVLVDITDADAGILPSPFQLTPSNAQTATAGLYTPSVLASHASS
jgi:hypothetical protein